MQETQEWQNNWDRGCSHRGVETGLQAHRRDKYQLETAGPTNTRDNQMAKGKHRNVPNRNQDDMAPSKPNSPTTASPGYPNTPEKQDLDLKSQLMILIEGNIHNSVWGL